MQIDEFTHRFFQMEMEENLFLNRTPSSDPAWDVVRFEVFISLFDVISEPGQTDGSASFSAQSRFGYLSQLQTSFGKVGTLLQQWDRFRRVGAADFVGFVCSRYKDANGDAIDFASHDAINTLSSLGSVRKIESQLEVFSDINFNSLKSIVARIYTLPIGYKRYFKKFSAMVAEHQRTHFGMSDPRLLEIVSRTYKNYLTERRVWADILDRTEPHLVLMVQNGIQKALILEARKREIPVVECQHGVINLMHAAYSYPPALAAGEAVLVPDALLLFSDYWKKQCCMPGTRLFVVGNDCFATRDASSTRAGAVVFVTAGIFQKYLSPLAMEIAQSMPDRRFIMKLHPSQAPDRESIETEYQAVPNLSVICMEKSLPALLSDSSDVVIVQSTASYEALERGVPVHILRKGGYMSHSDLFSRADVHVFSTADELRVQLFRPLAEQAKTRRFFQNFDEEAFRMAIAEFATRDSRNFPILEKAGRGV